MPTTVILGTARTPVGKMGGALASMPATELGGIAIAAALERSGVAPEQVDHVVMGQVIQAGQGQIPSRQAQIAAGIPKEVSSETVNKVCASGIRALVILDQGIRAGDVEVGVAGGMESMSNAPYLLPAAREGMRLGHGKVVDAMIQDGLWDAFEDFHMGNTGELVAERHRITRQQQDEFALNSHRKAVAAAREGRFRGELVLVPVPQKKGEPVLVAMDESPRDDASLEQLSRLKPVFKKDGTVTSGNAPGMNDGAAAVIVASPAKAKELGLEPMAAVAGQAVSGVEPRDVMMAPVSAVEKLLKKTGWERDAVDLYEINEAFSVQAIAVIEQLRLNPEKVNVNGGSVALGHPIGCSGARILVTLLHEMARRDARKGIAALCLGGGNAVAMAVER